MESKAPQTQQTLVQPVSPKKECDLKDPLATDVMKRMKRTKLMGLDVPPQTLKWDWDAAEAVITPVGQGEWNGYNVKTDTTNCHDMYKVLEAKAHKFLGGLSEDNPVGWVEAREMFEEVCIYIHIDIYNAIICICRLLRDVEVIREIKCTYIELSYQL
jgi:hypothetical protein